jgi:hypothetical protein
MRRALTALTVLVLLVPAPAALARDRSLELLRDACQDEKVDGRYSQSDYRKALDQLQADADEYTGCRDVLKRARLAAAGRQHGDDGAGGSASNGSTGSGGPGTPAAVPAGTDPLQHATPTERKAVEAATKVAKPVNIGGGLVRPGLARADAALPVPLLVALGLLAAAALGAGAWVLYTRVIARRAG